MGIVKYENIAASEDFFKKFLVGLEPNLLEPTACHVGESHMDLLNVLVPKLVEE